MTQTDALVAKKRQLLLHDLHGPVLYAKAFHSEITQTVEQLHSLLPAQDVSVSGTELERIRQIIADDLKPCLGYLLDVIQKLDTRIDSYTEVDDT